MKFHRIMACALFAGVVALANSAGPQPGLTGAPGEADCSSCHTGAPSGGKLTIALSAGGTSYTPGQTMKVKVTIEDTTAIRWGFQATARKASATSESTGKLESADNNTQVETASGKEYVFQTTAGTQRNVRNTASWEFNWTAPAAGTGSVTFYAAGNAANGNGSDGNNDKMYKSSLTLTEATGGGSTGGGVTATTHLVPMFVSGSGWSSTLYLVNNTDAEVSFDAKFRKNDGTSMDVSNNGEAAAATQKVTIAARGLGVIAAADNGSLAQGAAGFDLPDGVTGFVAVRLSAPNTPDQEVQIPVVKAADLAKTIVVFDDTKADTQLVVANAGGSEASVTMTVRDDKGATVGAASSFKLAAGAKAVFAIKDRVAEASGKRGTIELSGGVAAANIRFGGSALTATEALTEIQ